MKIVIVTGASSGIGKATAERLAQEGYYAIAGVRKEADFSAWKNLKNTQAVFLDVTKEESLQRAYIELEPLLKKATFVGLVNNAGIAVAGPIEGVPMERWREQFETNVFGLVQATQTFLPHIRRTSGTIVNISSVSGLAVNPYLGPYSASKFAVEAISDALRRELKPFGVQVAVIEPGLIATPIWEKNLKQAAAPVEQLRPGMKSVYGEAIEKFTQMVKVATKKAVPVEMVSEVVAKAFNASKPRTRYVIGAPGLSAAMKAQKLLPDRLVDFLISREFGRFKTR